MSQLSRALPRNFARGDRQAPSMFFRKVRKCSILREQDEFVCTTCGSRWPVDEEKPACSKVND
jgi:transposase-like protein